MMPALSAWTSSPAPGATTTDRNIRSANDIHFVLADPHRLDDDDVLPRRIKHERHVARRARQPTEVATCGHAADVDACVSRMCGHANAIAEDRSTGKRARRVHGDDPDRLTRSPDLGGQGINERAFAGSRGAGDADQIGAAGPLIDGTDERRRLRASSSISEIARNRPRVAGQHAVVE